MRPRVVVFSLIVTAGLLATGEGVASANVVWCRSDPPIEVVTPRGHHVMINNTVYLPAGSQQAQSQIQDDASATPDGSGGTSITVHVLIPAGVSDGQVVSTNHRYKVSAQGSGAGGTVITLNLDLPTS